jgi:hypothetical protein
VEVFNAANPSLIADREVVPAADSSNGLPEERPDKANSLAVRGPSIQREPRPVDSQAPAVPVDPAAVPDLALAQDLEARALVVSVVRVPAVPVVHPLQERLRARHAHRPAVAAEAGSSIPRPRKAQ